MIFNYLYPARVYKRLIRNIEELSQYSKFKKIVLDLNDKGKLEEVGIKVDPNSNMYIGIDLNPELLLYSETSQESVELRLVSEKMNKYNTFLTKEGILDSIKVEYERVQSDDFYGYILQIGFNFKKYRRSDFIYDLIYSGVVLTTIALLIKAII